MEINNLNSKPETKQDKPRSPMLDFLFLGLIYVLLCVYIPISLFLNMGEWFSAVSALAVCTVSALALLRMTGSFKPLWGYAIIVGFFAFLGGALLPISLYVSFVSSCVIYAYLIRSKLSATVWGLPVISAVVALLTVQNPLGVCLSLISLPASLMLALSIKNKNSRVGAVCRISAGICLSAVTALGLCVYLSYGAVTAEIIKGIIDSAKEQLTLLMSGMLTEVTEMLGDVALSVDSESLIALTVSSVFNLLPAVIVTLANITAYIIHSLYLASQYSMNAEARREAKEMLTFDMSIISAVIYIASTVLAFVLVSPETALYGTVAQNLILILIPGLVLTALAFVRALTALKGPSCLGTLLYFALIFLVVGLNPLVLMCVAFAGAVFIILTHIMQHKKDNRKE